MHRIIRTALATLGAVAVVSGGGLALSYATAPTADATATSTSSSADQVSALNKAADDLLAKISTLEKQLASTPAAASSSDGPLTRQDLTSPTPATTTGTQMTTTSAAVTASTALRNGDSTND